MRAGRRVTLLDRIGLRLDGAGEWRRPCPIFGRGRCAVSADGGCACDAGQQIGHVVIVKRAIGETPLRPFRILNVNTGVLAPGREELRYIGHWPHREVKCLQEFVCSHIDAGGCLQAELKTLIDSLYFAYEAHGYFPYHPLPYQPHFLVCARTTLMSSIGKARDTRVLTTLQVYAIQPAQM